LILKPSWAKGLFSEAFAHEQQGQDWVAASDVPPNHEFPSLDLWKFLWIPASILLEILSVFLLPIEWRF
jgi:hypothetical protein